MTTRNFGALLSLLSIHVLTFLAPSQASASGWRKASCVMPAYQCVYQYAPVCPPPYVAPKDQCIVYRWDACYQAYVIDTVCDEGDFPAMEKCARERVTWLEKLGVIAYSCCFKNKCNVYSYDFLHGTWKLERIVDSMKEAQDAVQILLKTGKYSTYCCYQDMKCTYPKTS